MTESKLDEFLILADHLADLARPIALKYFRSDLAIEHKSDLSPVTKADRETETALRTLIEQTFPDHGIIGEEFGEIRGNAEYVWVLDPIDGTQSFVTGKPLFGSLISLTHNGTPLLGIIEVPAMNERWTGAEGRPTTFNGNPVKVRTCPEVAEAWLYATTPHMFEGENFQPFEELRKTCKRTTYGADCYAYGLLASGFVDLVCEANLKPYDFCALVPVIKGAGGIITDWKGKNLTIHSDGRVLAAGDLSAHTEALETLTK